MRVFVVVLLALLALAPVASAKPNVPEPCTDGLVESFGACVWSPAPGTVCAGAYVNGGPHPVECASYYQLDSPSAHACTPNPPLAFINPKPVACVGYDGLQDACVVVAYGSSTEVCL